MLDLNLLDPKTPNYSTAHLFIGNSYRFRLPTVGLTDEEMKQMIYHYEEFMKYTNNSEGKRDVSSFLLELTKEYVPGVVKRWTITANEEQMDKALKIYNSRSKSTTK